MSGVPASAGMFLLLALMAVGVTWADSSSVADIPLPQRTVQLVSFDVKSSLKAATVVKNLRSAYKAAIRKSPIGFAQVSLTIGFNGNKVGVKFFTASTTGGVKVTKTVAPLLAKVAKKRGLAFSAGFNTVQSGDLYKGIMNCIRGPLPPVFAFPLKNKFQLQGAMGFKSKKSPCATFKAVKDAIFVATRTAKVTPMIIVLPPTPTATKGWMVYWTIGFKTKTSLDRYASKLTAVAGWKSLIRSGAVVRNVKLYNAA